MKYISTRNNELEHSLEEALRLGLAKDGGLFVPATFPQVYHKDKIFPETYPNLPRKSLNPFLNKVPYYLFSRRFVQIRLRLIYR